MGYRSYRVHEPSASGVCSPSYCCVELEETLPRLPQRRPHRCSSAWSERVVNLYRFMTCIVACPFTHYHEILKVITLKQQFITDTVEIGMGRLAQLAETDSLVTDNNVITCTRDVQ